MKHLILFIIPVIFASCSGGECCDSIDAVIYIQVFSNDGIDLLNPENENAFLENEIELYHLVNGETTKYFESHLDAAKGFNIDYDAVSGGIMTLFPNIAKSEEYPITYIHWNESDIDTLKCEVIRTDHSEAVTKVWYNDHLEWPAGNISRSLKIIK